MQTFMHEHAEVLNVLLSHARGLLDDRAVAANDGYQIYVLDLIEMSFIIEAKRSSKIAYTYAIRSYDRRYVRYSSRPVPQMKAVLVELPQLSKSSTMPRAIGKITIKGKK